MKILAVKKWMNNYLNRGDERNIIIKKNIIASFAIKMIGIILSLIIVPITINYISPTQYGLWLTISSIVTWIGYFDFGLAHGFRNRFTEAIAFNNRMLAKQYVSTTYAVLTIIFVIIAIILVSINCFIDWSTLLNVSQSYGSELRSVFALLTVLLCLNMIAGVLTTMLTADQRPAYSALFIVIGQFLSLVVIYVLTKTTDGRLLYLAFALSGTPLLVLIVASFVVFSSKRYYDVAPSLKKIRFDLTKKIVGLGGQFFLIMICVLLTFQMVNIIIVRICGPDEVTKYNIVYKYFSVLNMVMVIIITPFWSACTDAYIKKDYVWMGNSIKKLEKVGLLSICALLVMILVSPIFYKIWLGDSIQIPLSLSVIVGVYVLAQSLCGMYIYLINGTSRVRLQLLINLCFVFISAPTMYMLCARFGTATMLWVPIVISLVQAVVAKKQLSKIINGTASGIWLK